MDLMIILHFGVISIAWITWPIKKNSQLPGLKPMLLLEGWKAFKRTSQAKDILSDSSLIRSDQ